VYKFEHRYDVPLPSSGARETVKEPTLIGVYTGCTLLDPEYETNKFKRRVARGADRRGNYYD